MDELRPGDRIGAFFGINAKGDAIHFLGYGTLQERHGNGATIMLDQTGEVVSGNDFWYGSEEGVKRAVRAWEEGDLRIETVDILTARKAGIKREPANA